MRRHAVWASPAFGGSFERRLDPGYRRISARLTPGTASAYRWGEALIIEN